MTVDRVCGAGQRGGAQRQLVDALAAVLQAGKVAFQHGVPGQQVMTKGHWLSGLQVSEARHDGVGFFGGQLHQALLQTGQLSADDIDFITQVEADIGRYLIVA